MREELGDPEGAERALSLGFEANPRDSALRDLLVHLAAEHGGELGEPVRWVPRDELGDEIGSSSFYGGVVIERTGGLHPARFHAGLAELALAAGADLHDRTTAISLARRSGPAHPGST